jgi:hypothetical protein
MKQNHHVLDRFTNWKLLAAAFLLAFIGPAVATIPIWVNDSSESYVVPGNPPPTIDATAFDNENLFSVTVGVYNPGYYLYDTVHTLYYTNNDTMIAGSPSLTNGFYYYSSYGSGYQFDFFNSGLHQMAGTFYNPGSIRCNSIQDENNIYSYDGYSFYELISYGKCVVSATNLINPGTIGVSAEGGIYLTGQNVDLTGGVLFQDAILDTYGTAYTVNVNSTGAVGTDTNGDWNPGADLLATSAYSSYVPIAPYYLNLTNSTAYFDTEQNGVSNVIIRAVFIQNDNPNAPANVYIRPTSYLPDDFESGAAHVEWVGAYLDPASGQMITNYLYLTDNYAYGASTNVAVVNGVPDNYSLITSTTPLLYNPTAAGFSAVFPYGSITNPYAYMNASIMTSSEVTNSKVNPSGSITNLPGRIQIIASNDLNLAYATISGENYLSLVAPNQFDGSPGASISAAYSDINLGVTNGFLTITNLLLANIPVWSGSIQAWSTRWVAVDPTTGITNDYRVLIVDSKLQPTSSPWIQNLRLHGTNSLVINDALNVFGTVYLDAQRLTLATNQIGVGATSADGEFNWNNPTPLYANSPSGTQQLPNLLWLTNNGAIRLNNNAVFGSTAAVYGAFINTSLISDQGTVIWATNFMNCGTISNGSGAFNLYANAATLTNGLVVGSGDLTITCTNLVIGSNTLWAGKKLTLQVTNLLADMGMTNGNICVVGSASGGGTDSGFNAPVKPLVGDLLSTTVTNIAPTSKTINNLWAGADYGCSVLGYSNNLAIGRLILDAGLNAKFAFSGPGTSNALYVDYLELRNDATNTDANGNVADLNLGTNLVIYYAQAMVNGISMAGKLNHKNNDHLRWVPAYAGYYSSTNLVYPAGVTNTINAALVASKSIDSDGDGIANGSDATPLFEPGQVAFTLTLTNVPPLSSRLCWHSIPAATNSVLYTTNLLSANWQVLTNFVSPTNVPPVNGWPLTNTVYAPVNPAQQKYFRVRVDPNTTLLYGQ